jgi:23S rRNA (pseudouridine1915-N3)-methyltransferase
VRTFHLLCLGKLRDSHLEAIEANYLKRLSHPTLTIHELRASAENKVAEAEAVRKKIQEFEKDGAVHCIALSEWGKRYDSRAFAQWTARLIEKPAKCLFIIAGAEGFDPDFLASCQEKVSLSELTFPHRLARILLVEQLYRAQTLRLGHPYHN